MKWWARFAIGRTNPSARILLGSEKEPFSSLVDLTDCVVETHTPAEVWVEAAGDRFYVGWIDELGRLHARRSNVEAARGLAIMLADEVRGAEVEQCAVDIGRPNAVKVTGFEVWSRVARHTSILELVDAPEHTYHRFLAAVVRVD
jgi:hypothetical protein